MYFSQLNTAFYKTRICYPMRMKILVFILCCLTLNSALAASIRPLKGLYVCVEGNEESVCDQQLIPYFSGDKLTAIKVEYVGYCGSMGPYMYYCADDVCEDAGLRFDFRDSRNYRWENKQYKIFCEMTKK